MKTWLAAVVALTLIASSGVTRALAPAAPAADQPLSFDDFKKFNQDLVAAVADASSKSIAPPTLADPVTAGQIRNAFDERVLIPSLDGDLMGTLRICDLVNETLQSYLFYGIAPPVSFTDISNAKMLQENQNEIRFQDEVALATSFSVACAARAIQAASNFWRDLPADQQTDIRKGGIAKMRRGMAKIFKGVIMMQEEPIKEENRWLALDAVVKYVDVYASSMSAAERKDVSATADALLSGKSIASDTRDKLNLLRTQMNRTDCSGLCAI